MTTTRERAWTGSADDARLAELALRRAGKAMDMTRAGRCYELAAAKLTGRWPDEGVEGATLVHGSIQGGGAPRLRHAWVVLGDGRVWEPFGDDEWEPEDFERLFAAEAGPSYDYWGAVNALLRTGHWGPWKPGEDAPLTAEDRARMAERVDEDEDWTDDEEEDDD